MPPFGTRKNAREMPETKNDAASNATASGAPANAMMVPAAAGPTTSALFDDI